MNNTESRHHVRLNGVTYMPRVYRYMGPDHIRIMRTMEAPTGSEAREAGLAHFAWLYRCDRRTAFLIVRSIYLRPRRAAEREAARIAAKRIADCRRFGCCDV